MFKSAIHLSVDHFRRNKYTWKHLEYFSSPPPFPSLPLLTAFLFPYLRCMADTRSGWPAFPMQWPTAVKLLRSSRVISEMFSPPPLYILYEMNHCYTAMYCNIAITHDDDKDYDDDTYWKEDILSSSWSSGSMATWSVWKHLRIKYKINQYQHQRFSLSMLINLVCWLCFTCLFLSKL